MKALVYHGPGQRGWDTVADPTIVDPTDIVGCMMPSAPGKIRASPQPSGDVYRGFTCRAWLVWGICPRVCIWRRVSP